MVTRSLQTCGAQNSIDHSFVVKSIKQLINQVLIQTRSRGRTKVLVFIDQIQKKGTDKRREKVRQELVSMIFFCIQY